MGHIRPEDYNTALEVQDACNLQAVIKSFNDILTRIRDEARSKMLGTTWVNPHPICRLFVEQITFLTTDCSVSSDLNHFNEAYSECLKHATDACKVARPNDYLKKKEQFKEVIHGLSGGKAICGLPGIPKEWPEGHQWVDPKRAGGVLTCPTCIMVWKKATTRKEG